MKKLMVLMMAAFMVVGLVGTASAVDYTRNLNSTASVFASPVTETGTSVYVLSGGPLGAQSGVSLIAIDPTAGTSVTMLNVNPGASAYSTPAVISGETIFAQVSNAIGAGTSIFAFNGATGSVTPYYTVSFEYPAASLTFGNTIRYLDAISGATSYNPPLTLDPTGTSIYAASPPARNVSIITINRATGRSETFTTGVSAMWAAPAISGNSIYILGDTAAGVSLIAYNRVTPFATGVSTLVLGAVNSSKPFATPAVSGSSLFVLDSTGGLTAYSTATLARGTNDFIQFGTVASSQVTASPVTNGSYLVVTQNNIASAQAGVTVFDLSKPLAGSTGASWWFTWPQAGTTIIATPAISNGVLYTVVTEPGGGRIDRFNLAGHSGRIAVPDFTAITTDSNGAALGRFDYSSPIIKGTRLIVVSNPSGAANPRLYSFDLSAGGTEAWPQFKFDAARTGTNTATPAAAVTPVDDDDSGCFISTIK